MPSPRNNTRAARLLAAALLCLTLLAQPAALFAEASGSAAASGSQPAAGSEAASEAAEAPPEEETAPVRPAGNGASYLYEPAGFTTEAPGVCLINENSGLVVYEKNADQSFVAASLVKLMTAILAIEAVPDLDATTITAEEWVFNELYGKNASHADIRLGETLSVRELLYAALLPSGNEAALMLAGHVGGDAASFVAMMNVKAEALGCTGTTFADPTGLSEANRTTARDMCLLLSAFAQHRALLEITAEPLYEMQPHEAHSEAYLLQTTNRLVVPSSPYYRAFPAMSGSVLAGKTGSLGEWQNFAALADKEGTRYTCVVLNSPPEADLLGEQLQPPQARPAVYEAARLLGWAYENLSVRPALDTTQPITEVPVRYCAETDAVKLLPTSDMSALLPVDAADSDIHREFDTPEYLEAPVEEGTVVGRVTLSLDGQTIGTANLIAAHGAQRNNTLYTVRRLQEFFSSSTFKIILAVAGGLALLYAGATLLLNYLLEQKRLKAQRRQNKRPPGPK